MKKLRYFIIAFFVLITFNTIVNVLARQKHKTDYIKIAQTNIDGQEIESTEKHVHKIITKIENGELSKFSNQNNENNIIDKLDYAKKSIIQKRIKSKFGSYIRLHFESAYKSKTQNPFLHTIYRFKGEFESKKDIEIRLYLNRDREIVDLHVISWKKELFN